MPFYDYICEFCGHEFEKNLSIAHRHDPKSWTCPECHEPECFILKIGTPGFADPVSLGIRKPDRDVVNRLNKIKKDYGNRAGKHLKDFNG
jgi:putative FmdB family regulatory protein